MTHNYQLKRLKRLSIIKWISRLPFVVSLFSVLIFIYDIGFEHPWYETEAFRLAYIITLLVGSVAIIGRYFNKSTRPALRVVPYEVIMLVFLMSLILQNWGFIILQHSLHFSNAFWVYLAIFMVFFREMFAIKPDFKRAIISPAQLFVLSFLVIIVIGGFLLMLPNAANSNISFIDAMFTSTSAVCVTGLTVVDTGSFFTQFGQIIIIILIQIGGIGIMTFASYFSYFFTGSSSYEQQIVLSELTNTEKLGEIFTILKRIILLTFLIEGIGALLILQSISSSLIPSLYDRIFFSIFHSVSAFCNAGFSTLQNNLADGPFQFNYPLHLTIASLIIIGGLGFPVVYNLMKIISVKVKAITLRVIRKNYRVYNPWLININTRIVLITTFILLVFGTLLFYVFESNNTLSNYGFEGKWVAAFFGAVTTRTAGFNTIDTARLSVPTALVFIFLMWVGASPGSTGGGIKTSSLAIAFLNVVSIARGKSRIEVYKREISKTSVNRAFALIILSIFVISLAVFSILLFDPDKGLLNITFECVSAYSTVGLSRGITAGLTSASKLVLIFTMFIGRVSMLTLLIAVFKQVSKGTYRYPSEELLIN